MTSDAQLGRLAAAAGIIPNYSDLRGMHRNTTPETQRALLEVMGLPAHSDGDVAGSLDILHRMSWGRVLPPLSIVRAGGNGIVLTLPARGSFLRWKITGDGEHWEGAARLSDLVPTGTNEFGGELHIRYLLPLPKNIPPGYHAISIACDGHERAGIAALAPARCFRPPWLETGERLWGVSCQLYSLQSRTSCGIGDFGDLKRVMIETARQGGAVVAINPLHALFPGNAEQVSPYWPSSRRFLNPLYLDPAAVAAFLGGDAGFLGNPGFQSAMTQLNAGEAVPYPEVTTLKMAALRALLGRRSPPELVAAISKTSPELLAFARHAALSDDFNGRPWQQWPAELRSPKSPAVAHWAAAHEADVRFQLSLQWLAAQQLAASAKTGMAVGLMRDLAVGVSPDGADVWSDQNLFVHGVRFGAPPDAFALAGQDWGMPPPNPLRMAERAYAPFIAMIEANMAHAGALRIDHVMGLRRLFWIPPGGGPPDGAYVQYPMDDLLGLIALESERHRCFVIGEDLGTVPEGFRERMEQESILSTRLFYFERHHDGLFKRPNTYPAASMAQATTHDLPTLAGFWNGSDIPVRAAIDTGFQPLPAETTRAADRQLIVAALQDQGLLQPGDAPPSLENIILAVHRFLGRSPAQLAVVNLSDAMAMPAQFNLPGTTSEYPNWRLRLPLTLEALAESPLWGQIAAAMRAERSEHQRTDVPHFAGVVVNGAIR
jgi:4-alpha-glucanotransferase